MWKTNPSVTALLLLARINSALEKIKNSGKLKLFLSQKRHMNMFRKVQIPNVTCVAEAGMLLHNATVTVTYYLLAQLNYELRHRVTSYERINAANPSACNVTRGMS